LGIIKKTGGKTLLKSYIELSRLNPSYEQLKEFYITNKIDTTIMLQLHAENLASILYIMDKNPTFAEENPETQTEVFSNIASTIRQKDFTSKFKNAPIAAYAGSSKGNKDAVDVVDKDSPMASANEEVPEDSEEDITIVDGGDLSWSEVASCALEAIGSAVIGSAGLIKNLYNVITGYNLGYSGIVRVATSAFKTFAGSNAVGMAIGFGVCVVFATFWDAVDEPPAEDTTIYSTLDTLNWNYDYN
jgi:hypothetical protein